MPKKKFSRIDKNLARRLKEARQEVGLSVRAVATGLSKIHSISHTTIASYENGTTVPPIDVLGLLADIYQRPVNWFLDSRESLSGVRYLNLQSRVPLSEQRRYAAQAGKWAEAYIALVRHLQSRPETRWLDSAGTSPVELAHKIRTEHLNLDDTQPVQDMIAVLESFSGWAIELHADFGVDGAAAQFGEKTIIAINPMIANDRARLHAAHELAFLLFANDPRRLSTEVEFASNSFACSLLLPDSQVKEAFEGSSFIKLIRYRVRFGVSISAMIQRASELEVINTTTKRWLRSEITKRGWKRQEPGHVWKDRAITFETLLEAAIHSKVLTWEEAERITSIPRHELESRLLAVYEIENLTGQEDETVSLKFTGSP